MKLLLGNMLRTENVISNGLAGIFTFVLLNRQPDPTSDVTIKRKYSVLDGNFNYKKKLTWFDCEPEITTAVVEYIGEYTTHIVHGNAKTTTAPYRQLTSQQKKIRQGVQHGKAPREVRRDVNLETPDDIIDHRITQNAKYNNDNKSKPANIPGLQSNHVILFFHSWNFCPIPNTFA
jgi:hypothetical protein